MSGAKETPRQKLIGLMYLVLMAMLAMNVSKDVLDAFITINGSLIENQKNSNTSPLSETNQNISLSRTVLVAEK